MSIHRIVGGCGIHFPQYNTRTDVFKGIFFVIHVIRKAYLATYTKIYIRKRGIMRNSTDIVQKKKFSNDERLYHSTWELFHV